MPKYALYDHFTIPPVPVSGWYDTDNFTYHAMPAEDDLLELTEYEWDNRLIDFWAVNLIDDVYVLEVYVPPVIPQSGDAALEEKRADGILITSSVNPAMDGLWALDFLTMNEIGAVARDFSSGLGLPLGAPTFTYPMADGVTFVAMAGDSVASLYQAMRDCLYELSIQAAILENGGTPVWPSQVATID